MMVPGIVARAQLDGLHTHRRDLVERLLEGQILIQNGHHPELHRNTSRPT
jgi:hypothetical protein